MPVRLHHIVIDAHDLPGLARFWTRALGWNVLSERDNVLADPEGNEFCVVRLKETHIR
jgi:hypothetical protein